MPETQPDRLRICQLLVALREGGWADRDLDALRDRDRRAEMLDAAIDAFSA